MAARTNIVVAALFIALFCGLASAAGPCMPCKDCRGSNFCLQNCQRECPSPQIQVNGELCKRYGRDSSWKAAKQACENTLQYCNAGQKQGMLGAGRAFPVSLGQCANIAFGLCQEQSLNRWTSPCGYAFNGHNKCSKQQFMDWYNGEVKDACNKAVKWIDDLAEKTGSKP